MQLCRISNKQEEVYNIHWKNIKMACILHNIIKENGKTESDVKACST